ncbi:hypothetical protein [Nocardia sp. CA-119907]|uniref:hypothetical protein n=1 Tax=Nocardia sp. CA-119907 TaxID=3239973 RepID=UPI003D981065
MSPFRRKDRSLKQEPNLSNADHPGCVVSADADIYQKPICSAGRFDDVEPQLVGHEADRAVTFCIVVSPPQQHESITFGEMPRHCCDVIGFRIVPHVEGVNFSARDGGLFVVDDRSITWNIATLFETGR